MLSTSACGTVGRSFQLRLAILVLIVAGCSEKDETQRTEHGSNPSPPDGGAKSVAELSTSGVITEPQAAPGLYRRVRALCIGIDKYRSAAIEPLMWGEKDAAAIASLFSQRYGYEVETLLGADATKAKILEKLEQYAKELGEDDALILFCASHGKAVELDEHGRAGFMVPYDAEVDFDANDVDQWTAQAIDMRELADLVEKMTCRHVLLLADVCFSGFLGRRSAFDSRSDLQELTRWRSRLAMTAGTEKQEALEDATLKHGYFTHALIRQLDTDEAASATEVFVSVRSQVAKLTKGRMLPQLREIVVDNGEFVFVPSGTQPTQVQEALVAISKRANERIARRTTMSDVFESMEELDYRYAIDRPKREREWTQRLGRFVENAAIGDPLAMTALHYCYAKGLGTDPTAATAWEWAQRAYDTGHPAGNHVLGRSLLEGIGVEENERAAAQLFEQASDAGFPISQYTVARLLYAKDKSPTRDEQERAIGLLNEAAEAGFRYARWYLGLLKWESGNGYDNRALSLAGLDEIRQAADAGLATAQFEFYRVTIDALRNHGDWFEQGKREAMLTEAHRCLLLAANAGYSAAQLQLAEEQYRQLDEALLAAATLALDENAIEARSWVQLAAAQGLPKAQVILAYMLWRGHGGAQNTDLAKQVCESAAQRNFAPALTLQGLWYVEGDVYQKDVLGGAKLIAQAARLGDIHADFLKGQMLERDVTGEQKRNDDYIRDVYGPRGLSSNGESRARGRGQAAFFYLKAAKQGHAGARRALLALKFEKASINALYELDANSFQEIQSLREELQREQLAEDKAPLLSLENAESFSEVRRFHQLGPVGNVGFLSDGKRLFSAGSTALDGTVRIWDVDRELEIQRLGEQLQGVNVLAFSPKFDIAFINPRYTSILDDNDAFPSDFKSIYVRDIATGKDLGVLRGKDHVYSIDVSLDGRFAASAGEDALIRLWEISTGRETQQFRVEGLRVRSVAFSSDGSEIIAVTEDDVNWYDAETGRLSRTIRLGRQTVDKGVPVMHAQLYARDDALVTGGLDHTVSVWELSKGARTFLGSEHKDFVRDVALCWTAHRAVSCADDSTVRVWNLTKHEELHSFHLQGAVKCVDLSPDGRFVAAGGIDGVIHIWILPPVEDR